MTSRDDIQNITDFLKTANISFEKNISLKEFSYFQTGGNAYLIVYPANEDELKKFAIYMFAEKFEFKVIGETSNMMFLDHLNYGVFLSLRNFSSICYNDEAKTIDAQAGVSLPKLSRKALMWGLSGFSELEGIPGTLGGGIYMNAGAYGGEIKDHLLWVRGFRKNGAPFLLEKRQLRFKNRNSLFKEEPDQYIVTSMRFEAVPGNRQAIYERMELLHAKRHKYQDFLYPNLGTLFAGTDVYKALGYNDKMYRFKLEMIERLFYWKRIRRERPMNRQRMNRFVCNYFGWSFDVNPFSDKNMNCITNKGQHTDRFLEYIELLKKHLPPEVRLENEILTKNTVEG